MHELVRSQQFKARFHAETKACTLGFPRGLVDVKPQEIDQIIAFLNEVKTQLTHDIHDQAQTQNPESA
jgi:hypothetical protein